MKDKYFTYGTFYTVFGIGMIVFNIVTAIVYDVDVFTLLSILFAIITLAAGVSLIVDAKISRRKEISYERKQREKRIDDRIDELLSSRV